MYLYYTTVHYTWFLHKKIMILDLPTCLLCLIHFDLHVNFDSIVKIKKYDNYMEKNYMLKNK